MFHLIIYIIAIALYGIVFTFMIIYYILKFFMIVVIHLIKAIIYNKEKICYSEIKENFNFTQIKDNFDINKFTQLKTDKKEQRDSQNIREFKLIEPNDLEYKMEISKIQDLYKKLGFDVKVTNIKKNRYNTEYEVIFSRDINPYDIFAVSNLIIDEYSIDGVNIKEMKKEKNRLIVSIPLEYKEVIS